MLKLKPPISEAYKHFFDAHTHNLAATSIYRGFSDVNVYVDQGGSWLVTRVNHRILVSGDYMSSEAIEAVQRVVEEGIASGRRGFVIYYPSNAGNTGIGEHIQGINPYPNTRNYYRLDLEKTGIPIELPQGYRIEQVTKNFLEKGYVNTELVSEEMMSE
ncbi:MAG: hypothetical protein NWF07_02000, partial [Candidatus Bathyarchaeota archaeon]|nr:hypothetical protein [Candidatus Bathyarchaeota archaeon]